MLIQSNLSSGSRHAPHEAYRTDRSVPATFWAALREALAASHEYQGLRSRGVPHDRAIRTAFGMGRSSSHVNAPSERLTFAGRA